METLTVETKALNDKMQKICLLYTSCWIGAGSIINPGVTIGDGCVIASGSVFTRYCISNGLYAGVPAKMIKRLE